VSGSFALGLLTGLALQAVVAPEWTAVLGTGLLGGYTTFSTASVETVRLLAAGRRGAAVANGLGMLVACVGVASLGLWLGSPA
jgi:CrcB protein